MTDNKIAKINFYGGIIGLFFSKRTIINAELQRWNTRGYRAVQITSAPLNPLFLILTLFLLVITLFLFTLNNGVWILMEKEETVK